MLHPLHDGKIAKHKNRKRVGRPIGALGSNNRKKLSITLPVNLVEWLRGQDGSQSRTIEKALNYCINKGTE